MQDGAGHHHHPMNVRGGLFLHQTMLFKPELCRKHYFIITIKIVLILMNNSAHVSSSTISRSEDDIYILLFFLHLLSLHVPAQNPLFLNSHSIFIVISDDLG
jgi:hypothetical protein